MRRSSSSFLPATLMSSVFALLLTMGAADAGGGFPEPKMDIVAAYSTSHEPATASDAVTAELSSNGATVLATSGANAQGGIGSAASHLEHHDRYRKRQFANYRVKHKCLDRLQQRLQLDHESDVGHGNDGRHKWPDLCRRERSCDCCRTQYQLRIKRCRRHRSDCE